MFARPQLEISGNKTTLEYLRCCSFETVIGQQFHLVEEDIVYRIHSIHASPDGYMFSIQYEGIRYGTDCIPLLFYSLTMPVTLILL